MSIELTSAIVANIPNIFASKGNRLWNRVAPLTMAIKKSPSVGAAMYWTVSNGASGGGTIGEGDDINATEYSTDDLVKLTLSRAIYREAFGLTHTDLAVVGSLKPDMAADLTINRLSEAYLTALTRAARSIETALWSGTGSSTSVSTGSACADIVGLYTALTAASYGGATRSANAGLQPYIAGSLGTLTLKHMDQAIAAIDKASGTTPDFWMCSPKTFVAVKGIADTNVRFISDGQPADYNLGTRGSPLSGHRPVASVNGIPVLINPVWDDGYIFAGRAEDLEIEVLSYANWGDSVKSEALELISSNGEEMEKVAIPVKCYAPAKTGASVKFAMEVELGFKILRPNAMALLSGISTT